jgi:hypothetical protein
MIISQKDRDNYTKLCKMHMELHASLGKIKQIVNDEQVWTILSQAAKRLVGRKDMIYLDGSGNIVTADQASIKLSFTGFMKKDRWHRSWTRVRAHDMWDYLFKPALVSGLNGQTTKRNPEAFRDLVSVLQDGLGLKAVKDLGLDVSTKLKLPNVETVQEGLSSDATRAALVREFKVSEFELISTVSWGTAIRLKCITPDGESISIDDIVRQEMFMRFSDSIMLDAIFSMLRDAKKYVDEQYELKMEPQREFNKKYGQYLVAKEL